MYYGVSGTQYIPEATAIKSGGEGSIYPVHGRKDCLLKVYHPSIISSELEEKLRTMCQNPPSADVLLQVGWPIDVVYDASMHFVGFLMNRLSTTHDLDQIYKYPATTMAGVTLRHKLIIAENICSVIEGVHKAGYVFGDFNPMNIGVNINDGTVAFFDADTYHFKDLKSGRTHRCRAGCPGYIAPELLATCKKFQADNPTVKETYANAPLPTFTRETDNFALAIHIFKLIMNGYTPYNGIAESSPVSQASPGRGDIAVERNSYCFAPGKKPMATAVPELTSLPQYIQELFARAFEQGYNSPSVRPTAQEWRAVLTRFEQELTQCGSNSNHFYYNRLGTCPYCAADQRYKAEISKALSGQVSVVQQGQKKFSSAPAISPSGGGTQPSTIHTSPTANSSATGNGGSSMPSGLKVLIGVLIFIIICVFFKSMSSVDRTTVNVITSDFTIAVGQTAEVRINSSARRLNANYNGCIDVSWNNSKASGDMYYLDVTGVSTGTSVLKISSLDNDSKYDTVTITVVPEDFDTSADNSKSDDLQYVDANIVPLNELEYWNISNSMTGIGPYSYASIEDNMGNIYDVHFSSDGEWSEYKVDGAYSTFEGRFIIQKEYRSYDSDSYLWVYGDGQLLYGATMTGGTKPIDFRIDISGVEILKIKLDSATAFGGYEYTSLVNAYLCKPGYSYLGDEIPITKIYPDGATSLASLEWWDKGEYWIGPHSFRPVRDNIGNVYYESFAGDGDWQEYMLEDRYSTFVGRLIIEDEYNYVSDEGYVKVYGDGNLLYYATVTGGQAPVDFSVDIAGVQYLKIELYSPTRDGGREICNMVNAYLY